IEWFNGGLFDGAPVIPFTRDELRSVRDVSRLDWSQVEPAILGTLFERGLDPEKRGQLGAHYTDREKILMVVEPVVMQPLRREFEAMRDRVEAIIAGRALSPVTQRGARRTALPAWEREAEATWRAFVDRLRAVRVLDPACGSGNFLYVTLRLLKDLEQQAIHWGAERLGLPREFPEVGPHNLQGIEINPYAKELASVSIWVGHIQWMLDNGYGYPRNPVLQPLHNIEQRDAILARDAEGHPVPAEWPAAEFIVGNPPFLGDRMMRGGLGDEYVEALRKTYEGRVPGGADLVCYWHEVARDAIERGHAQRAGLLATNSIRGGLNRRVLERIKETGDIFLAWADEGWVVEGAAVRVSIVAQDGGAEVARVLDGVRVGWINSDLTASNDLTTAQRLAENRAGAYYADVKAGSFDVDGAEARVWLVSGGNPNGRPNSDVVRPWVNAADLVRRPRGLFIVDFGVDMSVEEAATYEAPFEYVRKHVKPEREKTRRAAYRENWWRHAEPVRGMRAATSELPRFVVTPQVSKHRVFVWVEHPTLVDHANVVIARDDDYAFGVLQSRAHERWSLRMGTSLEDRPRYTPTSTFETFPFPWPLNTGDDALTSEQRGHRDAIGAAAHALDDARNRWLNPPEWVRQEPDVIPSLPPRLVPVDEDAAKELAKRTLTNLYNARPAWLDHLHRDLDAAVFAAYDWPEPPDALDDETMLARLLALNLERAAAQAASLPAK
ncbi:MAG: class I SAM-dependent DNA methyltransferase, partial [Dehalococcoidia bacterium]